MTDNNTKPWLEPNAHGEMPGGICCQRAMGKVCYEHDPRNYTGDVFHGPFFDSTGKLITVGDRVLFRGQEYTIASFDPGIGRMGTARIYFREPKHTPEDADEINVDLLARAQEPS